MRELRASAIAPAESHLRGFSSLPWPPFPCLPSRNHRHCDRWPDHMTVPSFGPRIVCTACGSTGADVRPNWKEYQAPLM